MSLGSIDKVEKKNRSFVKLSIDYLLSVCVHETYPMCCSPSVVLVMNIGSRCVVNDTMLEKVVIFFLNKV